jgi:hypothetical protein
MIEEFFVNLLGPTVAEFLGSLIFVFLIFKMAAYFLKPLLVYLEP